MRLLPLVSLALSLANAANLVEASHDTAASRRAALDAQMTTHSNTGRRSLGFGTPHHSKLASVVSASHDASFAASADLLSSLPTGLTPRQSAELIAQRLLGINEAGVASVKGYRVRDDSYTDKESGMSYVYVKQLADGVDVADGDLQVVVGAHGKVVSYSSSFFDGPLSEGPVRVSSGSKLNKRDQMVFGGSSSSSSSSDGAAFSFNGNKQTISVSTGSALAADARAAALHFIAVATPDASLAASLSATLSSASLDALGITRTVKPAEHAYEANELTNVPGTTGAVEALRMYAHDATRTSLRPVWRLRVPMDAKHNSNFYEALVDVETAHVLSVVDWVKDLAIPSWAGVAAEAAEIVEEVMASVLSPAQSAAGAVTAATDKEPLYRVLKWGLNDPVEGNRTTESGADDKIAAPYGWHSVPSSKTSSKKDYDTLIGNAVIATHGGADMDDWRTAKSPRGSVVNGSLTFDFEFGWREADKKHIDLNPKEYADASTTNLFYVLNKYHDMLYRYGFTPAAGNFEEADSDDGGKGGDAIIAYSQSSAGINNADFTTPPDGQKPRVRMYDWKTVANATQRDGDFEAGVIIHEMTHGLSTRLTGGPSDSSCLGWGESAMMGEGAGDIAATIIRRKSPTRDIYPMGSWVSHNKAGIRKYPYSTNLTISPETYESLNGLWESHAGGEVWAAILYQLEEGLRALHGWHHSLFPPRDGASQGEIDEFYLTDSEIAATLPTHAHGQRQSKRKIPRHGNTLTVQLILDAMKIQPCRPSFLSARDAIITADVALTGGNNTCILWERFGQRGLGVDAKVVGQTPWGGGIRTNGHAMPAKCK